MTIRNQIRLATVKEYTENYVTIVLRQGEGFFSEEERTIPEVMVTRNNSFSQNLPDLDVDVLIAFDDTGEAYVLQVIGSDNQPLPKPDEPGTLVYDNGDDNPFKRIECLITQDAKLSAAKTDEILGALEIIDLLVEAIKEISISTVAAGGGPLLNASLILAFSEKIKSFKVV
jgi:hypothetical protein